MDEWHPFTISSAPEQEGEGDERRKWGGGCGMSGIPSLSAALQNRRVRGMKGGSGGGGCGMGDIPSLSAVLQNRRVRGVNGVGGGAVG